MINNHPGRIALAAMLALPLAAFACGVCIEDKVAATYDFNVIAKATQEDHAVAFLEVTGLTTKDEKVKKFISSSVAGARGVDQGSVRVSLDEAAISFAFNANTVLVRDLMQTIGQKLMLQHLDAKLIRLFNKGKWSEPF